MIATGKQTNSGEKALGPPGPQFSPACLLRLVIAGGSGVALYFPLDRVYSPSPAGKSARALLPPALPAPRDDIW